MKTYERTVMDVYRNALANGERCRANAKEVSDTHTTTMKVSNLWLERAQTYYQFAAELEKTKEINP